MMRCLNSRALRMEYFVIWYIGLGGMICGGACTGCEHLGGGAVLLICRYLNGSPNC